MVDADHCIGALPPNILAKIPHNLGLEYRSRWWELGHRIYGGITETDKDVVHIWHPSYDFHGERGIDIGYYNYGTDADSYAQLTPREREKRAVAAGVKIYGGKYRTELASSFSHHWRQTSSPPGACTSPVSGSATPAPGSTVCSRPHAKAVTALHARVLSV